MLRELHKNWIKKVYQIEESKDRYDDIYEVVLKLMIKKTDKKTEAVVTSLLTDVRSITRVTTVSSIDSKTEDGVKTVTIRVKFNVKNLSMEGFTSPQHFVQSLLIPIVQKLDTRPKVLSFSYAKDTFHKTKKK